MLEFKIGGVVVQATPDSIKIIDSYKIHKRKEIKEAMCKILQIASIYKTKRSINSFVNEWRCHNRCYNIGLFMTHTKDCDLESKQHLFMKIIYFIFGMF